MLLTARGQPRLGIKQPNLGQAWLQADCPGPVVMHTRTGTTDRPPRGHRALALESAPPAQNPGTRVCPLGVNYWKLQFYLRGKLECRVCGAVWPLIWWISSGFRPPGAVATDIRADSTLMRRNLSCRGQFRHYVGTIWTLPLLRFQRFTCTLCYASGPEIGLPGRQHSHVT